MNRPIEDLVVYFREVPIHSNSIKGKQTKIIKLYF